MQIDVDLSPHPRYRLLEQIGKGGMGEVFRAHDRLTNQVVALKRVRMPLPAVPAADPVEEKGKSSLGQAPTLAPEAAQPPQELAATMAAPPSDRDGELPPHQRRLISEQRPAPSSRPCACT